MHLTSALEVWNFRHLGLVRRLNFVFGSTWLKHFWEGTTETNKTYPYLFLNSMTSIKHVFVCFWVFLSLFPLNKVGFRERLKPSFPLLCKRNDCVKTIFNAINYIYSEVWMKISRQFYNIMMLYPHKTLSSYALTLRRNAAQWMPDCTCISQL